MIGTNLQILESASCQAKPFIKWVGGKTQLVDDIKTLLLTNNSIQCNKYAEPMIGGGAIFFELVKTDKFTEYYISDINPRLINTYIVIKKNLFDLIAELQKLSDLFIPLSDEKRSVFYYLIRDKFNKIELTKNTAVEKAAEFIFLNRTCFNGLYRENQKGNFNVPIGKYKHPLICDVKNLKNVNRALKNVTIICGDYSLSKSFIDKNTLVYLDPPYRPISKTSAFTAYNANSFTDNDQRKLFSFIEEINEKGAKFILSNSDPKNTNAEDTFFDDLYKDYNIKRVSASRMINSNGEGRGQISELLIYN